MATSTIGRRVGICLAVTLFVGAAVGTATAAGLQPGEYTCAGASGILIGLGFKLLPDGTYTDLDGTTSGRVEFRGSTVIFIGGHLGGYVGNNVRGGTNFEIHSISCSRN
jgi:hypothetical protein